MFLKPPPTVFYTGSGRPRLTRLCLTALAVMVIAGCRPASADNLWFHPDSLLKIDSVEIIADNVFDLTQPKYNNFLFRLANRCHMITRRSVVERELLLGKGDPYDSAKINESERNLRRLPFLLNTDIRLKKGDNGDNILLVNTSDRWTTTGGVSIHRSGGRSDLQVGLEENNLLGYGIFMSHDYFILEDDRNYYQLELKDNRLLGKKIMADLIYSDSPRVGRQVVIAGKPYYTLQQKWAGQIGYSVLKRRVDYYFDEVLSVRDRFQERGIDLAVMYRNGPPHIKCYFMGSYGYKDNRIRDRRYLTADSSAITPVLPDMPTDSIIHYAQATFRLQQVRYATYVRLNRFRKPEDVNLGGDAQISVGRAFLADGGRYLYLAVRPRLTLGYRTVLMSFGVAGETWLSGRDRLRRVLIGSFKGYWKYHRHQTLVVGLRYRSDRFEQKTQTMYLDEDRGLRGYPAYYTGGEDRIMANIENRFFSDLEILSVGLGGVAFADIGNIWSRDGGFSFRETQAAFGIGLRFGTSRSSQAEIIRFDLAYAPSRENWQISFGTGQFF